MLKKILIIFLSVCSSIFLSNAYATIDRTHVTLTNNTNESMNVRINFNSTDKDFNHWEGESVTLLPYQSKEVLWFGRNVGVKNNVDYDFTVSASNPNFSGENIDMNFRMKGKPVYGSDISTDLTLPKQNKQTVLTSDGLFHYPAAFWNGNYIVHARTWRPTGNLFNDYQFVIDKPETIDYPTPKNTQLSVLTYNTQLMPFYANGVDDLNEPKVRERLIPSKIAQFDVVMMQELLDKDLRNNMIKDMNTVYPYHTKVVGDGTTLPLTGGVVIFSKWPILKEDQIVFSANTGVDGLAAKGVGYAKINKNGQIYHVFATHMISEYTDVIKRTRAKELAEFENFVERLNIPENEPVIFGGDFNVDQFSTELDTLLATMHVKSLDNLGYQYSCDTLVDTMNNTKERTRLDYVFYSNQHVIPKTAFNKVYVLRSLSDEEKWPKFDLSDHFPVAAFFDFSA